MDTCVKAKIFSWADDIWPDCLDVQVIFSLTVWKTCVYLPLALWWVMSLTDINGCSLLDVLNLTNLLSGMTFKFLSLNFSCFHFQGKGTSRVQARRWYDLPAYIVVLVVNYVSSKTGRHAVFSNTAYLMSSWIEPKHEVNCTFMYEQTEYTVKVISQ